MEYQRNVKIYTTMQSEEEWVTGEGPQAEEIG